MRKLYLIEGTVDSYLLVDGDDDRVINGDYKVESSDNGKTINVAKEYGIRNAPTAHFVANVPAKVRGDYNEVLDKMREILAKKK